MIESGWEYLNNEQIQFTFTVPFGTEAELLLPDGTEKCLKSGKHAFLVTLPARKKIWDRNTVLEEILVDPEAMEILEKHLPGITVKIHNEKRKKMFAGRTLEKIVMAVFNEYTLIDLEKAEKDFAKNIVCR